MIGKKMRVYRTVYILGIGIKIRDRKSEKDVDQVWERLREYFKDDMLTPEQMDDEMVYIRSLDGEGTESTPKRHST